MNYPAEPVEVLKRHWGFDAFRPLQEDIIRAALAGRDVLALLPTGGGKSICYQVPALCREGIAIVVSPLIALMKDQVHHLRQREIPAAAIYAGMSQREVDIVFENAVNGAYKLLYLSPERLQTPIARERIRRMNVNLLAVDEAHCISQWGYDFRPPYLLIADIRELMPHAPILALTATATPEVVEDIRQKLQMKDPQTFQQSFLRPNLSYSVLYEARKHDKLLDIFRRVQGSGIVYARSRGETQTMAKWLNEKGVGAHFYHAGLSAEERDSRQMAWLEGRVRVMACTNAFGMGIDKPDVRIVVHQHLPESLEAYFQEAGRAGRDGQKAYAVLLYSETDAQTLRRHLDTAFPPIEQVRAIYRALGSYSQLAIGGGQGESIEFDLQQFCLNYKFEQPVAHQSLRLLENEGWIALSDAVLTPSSIHISATREILYDFQLRNKQADAVIKALLRAYPGISQDVVEISEHVVARLCKLPTEAVVQALQSAHQQGVLLYRPKSEKPKLTFLQERVAAENLTIDIEKFNFRKKNAQKRVESAIQYAENRRCRSQLLLAYFGEKNSPRCGICDVCTGRNESDLKADTYAVYEKKIKDLLRHEPLSVPEILESFAMRRHEIVAQALDWMLGEGILKENAEGKLEN